MSDNSNRNHDLTVIKGIGKTRARWFQESLDVKSLRDLSRMSVDVIEAQLKAEGLIASRNDITDWIIQAQKIVAESQIATVTSDDKSQWKPYASFVIEYQNRVQDDGRTEKRITAHHMETDESAVWSENVEPKIIDWIHSQVGETSASSPLEPASDNEALQVDDHTHIVTSPTQAVNETVQEADFVHITQVQAYQPTQKMIYAGAGKAGQPFLGTLKSEEPFALEAWLEFEVMPANMSEAGVPVMTQFYAFNRTTGSTTFLGNIQLDQLDTQNPAQKALLPKAQLAKGLYRLQVSATIQSTPPMKSYLEVPFMQVS